MSIVEKAVEKRRHHRGPAADPNPARSPDEAEQNRQHVEESEEPDPHNPETTGQNPHATVDIDLERFRQFGLWPPEEYSTRLVNEYRSIKRPLLDNLDRLGETKSPIARLANRIVVTSALPGEGKTFTTVNLALSLARERDYKVILVDGDMLRPRATEALGLIGQPGFGDLLADESLPVGVALFRTNIESLWVVPSGRRDPFMAEHLSSRRADQILVHLSRLRSGTLLIMDSPPLLPTTEAPLLAARAGQVVLVIKAGATAQYSVRHALASLREDHAVSLLLNQTELPKWQDYYSQYSDYYGYYSGSRGDSKQASS